MREREQKKKADEAEFDRLRALLGPKLKEWSEQYGKKKDIRALLAISCQKVFFEPGHTYYHYGPIEAEGTSGYRRGGLDLQVTLQP